MQVNVVKCFSQVQKLMKQFSLPHKFELLVNLCTSIIIYHSYYNSQLQKSPKVYLLLVAQLGIIDYFWLNFV